MDSVLPIILPSFHSRDLLLTCMRSFEKFAPDRAVKLRYIVVENSDDTSYKDEVLERFPNATWINNLTKLRGSEANAVGVEVALKEIDETWAFMAHIDTCVTHPMFFSVLFRKTLEECDLVGTVLDPIRINAVHISGLLTTMRLASKVSYYPRYDNDGTMLLDVGDELTEYADRHGMRRFCFQNTFNNPELIDGLPEKFANFNVDRSLDEEGNVMFMHLGRGTLKTRGKYSKAGKVSVEEWVEFCGDLLDD